MYAVLAHTDAMLVILYSMLVRSFLPRDQLIGWDGSEGPSKSTVTLSICRSDSRVVAFINSINSMVADIPSRIGRTTSSGCFK